MRVVLLNVPQNDICLGAGNGGDAEQKAFEEKIVGLDIRADDVKMVVCLSRGCVAGAHLGAALDGLDKGIQLVRIMSRQVDMDNSAKAKALFAVIQRDSIVANDTAFLQRLDPAPAGGWRQSHPIGQIGVRNAAVGLESLQNTLVHDVEVWHDISPYSFRLTQNFTKIGKDQQT